MILIGQYDSPFARRVGVTLRCYAIPYEHRRWSVWGDADKLAEYNPLRRVPTLILDDGVVMTETFTIVATLDELVGADRALLPASGAERREGLRIAALASGLADKAVSLLYERLFRPEPSATWTERCTRQIRDTLELLEKERAARPGRFYLGATLSHADVAAGCALRFIGEAHPSLFDAARYPALAALGAECEALPEFSAVVQPIENNL